MRIYHKESKTKPATHEIATFTKFAWKPITIGKETRWLEKVTFIGYYWIGPVTGRTYWEYIEFVDGGNKNAKNPT